MAPRHPKKANPAKAGDAKPRVLNEEHPADMIVYVPEPAPQNS
jgi:hypothetical protein